MSGIEVIAERGNMILHLAYLMLGSNIRAEINLPAAVRELARFGRVVRISSVWQSPPVDGPGQPDYLNAALILETRLTAPHLKIVITSVEEKLGRLRSADRNAARTIDIDIALFDREKLQLGNRRIPDPEILERPFVAIPLAEIAPDYLHPDTDETLAGIASSFDPLKCGMNMRGELVLETDETVLHS